MKAHILSKFYKQFFINGNNIRKEILISNMNKYIDTGDFSDASAEFKNFINDYSSVLENDEKFGMGLMSDFPKNKYPNILEVACGNNFTLSEFLAQNGYNITAIDPKVKSDIENNSYGIKYLRSHFICDDIVGKGNGTDISNFDCLTGIRPCAATEHIIRQSLNYNKPFNVMLCNCSNRSIYGEEFSNRDKWYSYLISISQEVKIIPENSFNYITNLDKVHSEFMATIPVQYDFFQ